MTNYGNYISGIFNTGIGNFITQDLDTGFGNIGQDLAGLVHRPL
jgi:hypothetical protein